MALIARLQFGDNNVKRYAKEYLVTDFKCRATRRHNGVRPDSDAMFERIDLTVIAPGRQDLNLYQWYANGESQNGRILIELSSPTPNGMDEWKQVLFEDASCFAISENYSIDNRKRRELTLSIMAMKVTVDDVIFTK